MHCLRSLPLSGPQQLRIETELENRATSGLAGELCVDDFVRPVAEGTRLRHASEDVGPARPAATAKGGLGDDVMPCVDGGNRLLERLVQVGGHWQLDDLGAAGYEVLEVGALVSQPAFPKGLDFND